MSLAILEIGSLTYQNHMIPSFKLFVKVKYCVAHLKLFLAKICVYSRNFLVKLLHYPFKT
jgi:hypothetical protein